MDNTIDELKKEKDDCQNKANILKEKRNKLHSNSKKLADDRDNLNSIIRTTRNNITIHKKNRDELNERVQHAKEQRNKLNANLLEIKKRIKKVEQTQSSTTGTKF